MTSDDRLTSGLILDVLDVLERHGYHPYDNQHTGQAIGAILDLAYVYDGTRDVSYLNHASPGPHSSPTSTTPRRARTPNQDHPTLTPTTRSSSPAPKSALSSPRST
jgi:hypothetical protein